MRILVFKRGSICRIFCYWNLNQWYVDKRVFVVPWNELSEFIAFKKPKQINVYSDDY